MMNHFERQSVARFGISFVLAFLFSCFVSTGSAEAVKPLTIAENKTTLLQIIVADTATESVRDSASELAGFLERISGASFSVVSGNQDQAGIFVGTLTDFPKPEFRDALEISNEIDGVEAFVIAPRKGSLYLLGATETGTSHAVFRFLERLGCRWYFPGDTWEVIPKLERVVADFEEFDRPVMLSRRITPGGGFFDRKKRRAQEITETWRKRNRMGYSFRSNNGHAWQTIIAKNQATFDEHPEYLAQVKGVRRKPQLCVSNPEVRRIAVAWALSQLELRPELEMISMECSDGFGHCECKDCLAMGSVPDRVFGLANEVAKAVSEKFPGKMVGMLAYSDHSEPPGFDLEPNVFVQLTTAYLHGDYDFDELLEMWPKKAKRFGIYEYYSIWPWDHDQLPGGKANDIERITTSIRRYTNAGVGSMNCEAGNNWGPYGRGYYVANRLMWNPDTNVEELLTDFYDTAFGPASEVMRRFYERFDRGNQPLMSEHLLGLGYRDIAEADHLAADSPVILARLNHLKQYLHYVRMRWDLDRMPKADPKRKELTLDILTWSYRTRFNFMNHWAIMRSIWTHAASTEFDEPTWSYRHTESANPWAEETPVTTQETNRKFAEDLSRFQVQEGIDELTFSDNLTPAFPDITPPEDAPSMHQLFQREMRYALFSPTGEPFRFSIRTKLVGVGEKAPGRWTISDSGNTAVGSGKLPQDGETHEVVGTVPSPGLYWLSYDDNGAGWEITFAPGTYTTLALKKGSRITHLGPFRHPVYFFVPKGTGSIQYFREGGNSMPTLHDPDGALHHKFTESDEGKIVSVPVPPGMDGKVWSFQHFNARQFWMMNLPNFFSVSPEALLIPRETVNDP